MSGSGVVHLACAEVAALLHAAPPPPEWLSASERDRLDRIKTSRRRDQFMASRWQARTLLAQALGGTPRDWPLQAPVDAPPGVAHRPELSLAVSHSGGWSACALGDAAIGLDLEAPLRRRDIAGLVEICCTTGEQELFAALPEAGREDWFYELWTVKEAWLKRRREWIAPLRLRQLDTRPDAAGEVRTWDGGGWRLALCAGDREVRWCSPQPAASCSWRVRDSL